MGLVLCLAGCGGIAGQMEARDRACSARGGVLTAMGCQGGGGGAFSAAPGRIDTPPATDRYGQQNYDAQGRYVGRHGLGTLVDRPPAEPVEATGPAPMPGNVTCVQNAAGNAASCSSR